jgi:hypothetical protein
MMTMKALSAAPSVLVLCLAGLASTPAPAEDFGLSALVADMTALATAVDEQDSSAGKTAQCRACPSTDPLKAAGPGPKNSSGRKAGASFVVRGSTAMTGAPTARDAPAVDISRSGPTD